jgi:hypothetical protein
MAGIPKRAGGNSKAAAWKAWKARIKDGVTTEAMLAGVNRYAVMSVLQVAPERST